jgi:hypothetical protein
MTTKRIHLLVLLALMLVFNFLFWEEKMGLNCLVFTPAYLGAVWYLFPEGRASRYFLATAAGTLLCALMVLWHNSQAAKLAFMVSGMCAAGFAQTGELRHLGSAVLQYLNSMFFSPRPFFASFGKEKDTQAPPKPAKRRQFRFGLTSFAVLFLFYVLYYVANKHFAELADRFWGNLFSIFNFDISFTHLLFWVLAFFLCGGAVWYANAGIKDAAPDDLRRTRPDLKVMRTRMQRYGMMDLLGEYTKSNTLLLLLNALLLVVNLTDVWYVWFGYDGAGSQDLQSYVHEGTYMLIFSILVAMVVLFYVFRRNLNFFPDNQTLRWAATAWLVQNAILAISVGIRNWRYIDFHGLAYKRIGVFLFLALVFFGLYTLWQKIDQKKTMSWLWRRGGWVFYGLFLANACVPWDTFITQYNLSGKPKGPIDLQFLIYNVSDKNLPILMENQERLATIPHYPTMNSTAIHDGIQVKRQRFWEGQRGISGKSWNRADDHNRKASAE